MQPAPEIWVAATVDRAFSTLASCLQKEVHFQNVSFDAFGEVCQVALLQTVPFRYKLNPLTNVMPAAFGSSWLSEVFCC